MSVTPTAFYKFDEASGSATDSTGGGRDLTDNNSCGSAAGKIGNSRSLNGTSQYFSSTDAAFATGGSTSWTWWGWIYVTTTVPAYQYLVARDNITGRVWSVQIGHPTGGKIGATLFDNGGTPHDADSGVTVSTSTWYFVVVRYNNGTGKLGISVDGAAFVEASGITTAQTAAIADSPLNIGRRAYPSAEAYTTGRVDAWGFISGTAFDDAERDYWWNSGTGREYAAAGVSPNFLTLLGVG